MYICFEGVKGSGKTTLLENITQYFLTKNTDFVITSPTKPTPQKVWWEYMADNFEELKNSDDWKQKLYACRANWVAKHTNWQKNLVLGDRSIITSYATRWHKWENPNICIQKTDKLQKNVIAPDVVIYLDISVDIVLKRLQNRVRDYGKSDETPQKIALDMQAYQEIKNNKYKLPKLQNTHWISLNAEQNPEKMLLDCVEIIENLKK
jgi:thymidylate kinase